MTPSEAPRAAGPDVRPRRRRRRRSALVTAALAAGVVWWLLQPAPGLAVEAATASPSVSTGCGQTAHLAVTVRTDGEAGQLVYRWRRSDGTRTGLLVQPVAAGQRETRLVLDWEVRGRGRLQAWAVAELVGPERREVRTAFRYACQA